MSHMRFVRASFRNLLCVKEWRDESHLLKELQSFESAYHKNFDCIGDWNATCRYVFQALERIVHSRSQGRFEPWVNSILLLPIFPITRRDGSRILSFLSNAFVPDSPLLNPLLQHRVDSLNFAEEPIYQLIQLLKCARPPPKFLSSYDHKRNIRIIPRLNRDIKLECSIQELIKSKRFYVTRYLLSIECIKLIVRAGCCVVHVPIC